MSKRAAGICGAKGPATQALMSAERTPCLKCLCNYSVQDACLCSVCCRPHRQEKAEGGFVRKGTLTLDPFFKISEVPKFHNERSSSFATHRDSRSSLRNPSAVLTSVTMKHYAAYLVWKLCISCILFRLSLFVVTRQVGVEVEGGGSLIEQKLAP